MTICNSNRVSCSQLKKTYEEWDVENDLDTFDKLSVIKTLSKCPDINEPTTETTPAAAGSRRKRSIYALDKGLGDTPDFLKTELKFLDSYMGLNESMRLLIGHQFHDFIKKCTYSGSDCLNIRYLSKSFSCLSLPFLSIITVTLKW